MAVSYHVVMRYNLHDRSDAETFIAAFSNKSAASVIAIRINEALILASKVGICATVVEVPA